MRTAPQALDSERDLIGSVLLDPSAAEHLLGLPTEAFYSERHRAIVTAIQTLINRGDPLDLGVLRNELDETKQLDAAGGLPAIIGLYELVGSGAWADRHAAAVLRAHRLREIIRIAGTAMKGAYDGDAPDQILSAHETELTHLTQTESIERGHTDYARDAMDYFAGEGGIPTGFADLDRFTGGLTKGGYNVIAGRPSMGKSSVMRSILQHRVQQGDRVCLFSVDQSGGEIFAITAAQRAGVRLTDFHRGGRTPATHVLERVTKETMQLTDEWADNFIIHDSISDYTKLMRTARREIRAGATIIAVDHLQSISQDGTTDDTKVVSTISRGFKALAREFNITVLVLSQLGRDVENTPTKRPSLRHLRQSGAIEEDANQVLMLYRADYYADREGSPSPDPGTIEIIVEKNKLGGNGIVKLTWLPDQIRAVNRSKPTQEQTVYRGN